MLSAEPFPGYHQIDCWLRHNAACKRVRDWVLLQDALVLQCVDLRKENLPGDYSDQRHGNGHARKIKCHGSDMPYWSATRIERDWQEGYAYTFEIARGIYGKPRLLTDDEPGSAALAGQEVIVPPTCTMFKAVIVWANNNYELSAEIARRMVDLGYMVKWLHWDGQDAVSVQPKMAIAA